MSANRKQKGLTYEGLVSGLWEATLLIQKWKHPHGLLQEQVQEGPVVLILNHASIDFLIQVLILYRNTSLSLRAEL